MTDKRLTAWRGFTLDEVLTLFGIDSAVRSELRIVRNHARQRLPFILDGMYVHLSADPRMAAFVEQRGDRLKHAQIRHLTMLLSGEFTEAYLTEAKVAGAAFARADLPPGPIISAFNFVQQHVTMIAFKAHRDNPARACTAALAVQKAFGLDMSLTLFHQRESATHLIAKLMDEGDDRFAQAALERLSEHDGLQASPLGIDPETGEIDGVPYQRRSGERLRELAEAAFRRAGGVY